MPDVLWEPPSDVRERSRIGRWLHWLEDERGLSFEDYHGAWRWSVEDLEGFWASVWDHFGLRARTPADRVLASRAMPGARWFPGLTLNYAENVLDGVGADDVAIVARSQTRPNSELTGAQLRDQVARARAGLRRLGVGRGDRVVAYAPNIPETLVVFLATASLGAVFSSCPPEFGARAVLDRFSQIEPKVLVAVDGYLHKGLPIDRRDTVERLRAGLPTVEAVVTIAYLGDDGSWAELLAERADAAFEPVAFDHPLYVLYSSGTTGLPKPIVHGHGGVLLEHVKVLGLHHDLGPGDRFFWFSTTGWMMWNYMVSALAVGASIVTFDGDPGYPDLDTLWAMAAETGITAFGASAPFLLACRKAGMRPGRDHDLSAVRQVGSTGAPLPAEGFRWVYDAVGRDLMLVSASGGTDVVTAFVAGVPLLPVVAGEITCRCLGAKVEAFDDAGTSVVGAQGNLVITEPLPSMPVGFWGDTDGSRYRAAYFEEYPGVWCHGDWITITERGSCVITGRSDATLNRGGVRLGTSDFYAVVEALPEVADSLVVHLEDDEGGPGELLLFVQTAPGCVLDDTLRARMSTELRTSLSPRHVPDEIIAVAVVPRTLSGKKLEIPVKRILLGTPAAEAAARGALADPSALDAFEDLARTRAAG
ncbi:MAG: acetoacetyl-CoA synthetase [Actinomycetota bacterium]|nr:acetoacetyl-CoA synthetase [Actinomycetota bacterium]